MSTASIIIIIINIALAVVLAVALTPLFVWWERRISAFIQDRSDQIDVILDHLD